MKNLVQDDQHITFGRSRGWRCVYRFGDVLRLKKGGRRRIDTCALIRTQLHFVKAGISMVMMCSAMRLGVPGLDKHVIRDSIPSVMNAGEEQQQRRRSHGKQGLAQMGASGICRCSQH
jgi:hypothetical protein